MLLHQAQPAGRAGGAVTHPRPLSSEQEQKEGAQLPPVATCTGARQTLPFGEGAGQEAPSASSPQPPPLSPLPSSPSPQPPPLSLLEAPHLQDCQGDPGAVPISRTDPTLGDVRAVPMVRGNTNHPPELWGQRQEPGLAPELCGTPWLLLELTPLEPATNGGIPQGQLFPTAPSFTSLHPCVIAIVWHLPSPCFVLKHVTRPPH